MLSPADFPVSLAKTRPGAAGATVSRVKPPNALLVVLPATSLAVLETLTAPWPRVARLAAVRVTACAAPLPARVLVTEPAVPVKTTLTAEPFSALTVTTPPAAVAAAAFLAATPWATTARAGATVSRAKPPVLLVLVLPAASRAVVVTVTAPSPRLLRSAPVRLTAWAPPLAVKDFVTVLAPLLNTTLTAAPLSALTLSTPPAAVASAAVLALSPRAMAVRLGGMVSRPKPPTVLRRMLPAGSVAVVVTDTAPLPRVARLASLSVTA